MCTRPRTIYRDTEENPRKASGGELCFRLSLAILPALVRPGPGSSDHHSDRGSWEILSIQHFLGESVSKQVLVVFSVELPLGGRNHRVKFSFPSKFINLLLQIRPEPGTEIHPTSSRVQLLLSSRKQPGLLLIVF